MVMRHEGMKNDQMGRGCGKLQHLPGYGDLLN